MIFTNVLNEEENNVKKMENHKIYIFNKRNKRRENIIVDVAIDEPVTKEDIISAFVAIRKLCKYSVFDDFELIIEALKRDI